MEYPINMVKAAIANVSPAGFAVASDAGERAKLESMGYTAPAGPDVGTVPKAPEKAAVSPQLMYEAGRLGVEVQADWSPEQLQAAVDDARAKGFAQNGLGDQARSDLEAQAKSLGVKFDGRTSDGKLQALVDAAKNK